MRHSRLLFEKDQQNSSIPSFARVVAPEFLSVRTPDMLTVNDFEGDNALLISGPFGDPWAQLFDHSFNFQFETGVLSNTR